MNAVQEQKLAADAQRHMSAHEYDQAFDCLKKMTHPIAVQMWLLVMEHEVSTTRAAGITAPVRERIASHA